jgi:chromate transporter
LGTDKKTFLKLFTSTFFISAFTFGGGFVIVPLLKRKFVEDLKWIDEKEMMDFIAIAQSSPGAVAINTSILIGYKTAGAIGAALAISGTVLPPFIVISVISLFYLGFRDNAVISAMLKGMQAGIAAVIADAVYGMGAGVAKERKVLPIAIMTVSFLAAYVFKINVVYIILVCGIAGAVSSFYRKKSGVRHK